MTWRRSFRLESNGVDAQQQAGFVPAMVIAAETPSIATVAPSSGQMVIIVGKDRRVIVDAGVDAAALARLLDVLERR
jgi:transposase